MYCDTLQVQIQKSINRLLLRSLFKVVSAVALYFHLSMLELVCEDDRCLTVIAFLLKKKKKSVLSENHPVEARQTASFATESVSSLSLSLSCFFIFF